MNKWTSNKNIDSECSFDSNHWLPLNLVICFKLCPDVVIAGPPKEYPKVHRCSVTELGILLQIWQLIKACVATIICP